MNPRERLQYALYLRRLQDLFVIKENIAFEYQHKNFNKAAAQIDKVVDQCLNDNILNTVDGTVSLKNPKVDHVITEALASQHKMLVKRPDKFMEKAVRDNTKQFSNFLQNRIEKENYSLQNKINEEYKKKEYSKMPEAEAKKILTEKFEDHARKRAKNIVRDALHTNQSHMSWINGIQGDFKYKVWMNGQGKGRVRPWHRAKLIQPVEIDDYFDIYGSSHVQMMYPGDLEGGAENVANCRCWLHYTNIAPRNLKPRGTIQINPNVNISNNARTFTPNTGTKGRSRKPRGGESPSTNKKLGLFTNIRNKLSNIGINISNKFGSFKQNLRNKRNNKDTLNSGLTNFNDTSFKKESPYTLEEVKEKWLPNIPIKKVNKKISNNHRVILEEAYSKIKNIIKDPNREYGYARSNDGKYIELEQVSEKEVDLPNDVKEKYGEEGLFLLGHNHPAGESPLGSPPDICNYVKYRTLMGFSFNENGFFLVINRKRKLNRKRYKKINAAAKEVNQKMLADFHKAKFNNVNEAKKLEEENKPKYNAMLHEFVIPRQKDYVRLYKQKLRKYGLTIIFI